MKPNLKTIDPKDIVAVSAKMATIISEPPFEIQIEVDGKMYAATLIEVRIATLLGAWDVASAVIALVGAWHQMQWEKEVSERFNDLKKCLVDIAQQLINLGVAITEAGRKAWQDQLTYEINSHKTRLDGILKVYPTPSDWSKMPDTEKSLVRSTFDVCSLLTTTIMGYGEAPWSASWLAAIVTIIAGKILRCSRETVQSILSPGVTYLNQVVGSLTYCQVQQEGIVKTSSDFLASVPRKGLFVEETGYDCPPDGGGLHITGRYVLKFIDKAPLSECTSYKIYGGCEVFGDWQSGYSTPKHGNHYGYGCLTEEDVRREGYKVFPPSFCAYTTYAGMEGTDIGCANLMTTLNGHAEKIRKAKVLASDFEAAKLQATTARDQLQSMLVNYKVE